MIQLAADENFDLHITRALQRRVPQLDVRTVQDAGLSGADDPTVLAWAAREDRVLLTHDVNTMTRYAYERVLRGEAMPGVIAVSARAAIGQVVEDLVLIVTASTADDWRDQVHYLPWS